MQQQLLTLARKLRPDWEALTDREQSIAVADIFGVLYSSPLVIAGLTWLILSTEMQVVLQSWPIWLLVFALNVAFNRLDFTLVFEVKRDRFVYFGGSLDVLLAWSALLIWGPTALWIPVVWQLVEYLYQWRKALSSSSRWSRARNLTIDLARITISGLIALALYRQWGGAFPLASLGSNHVGSALAAVGVNWALSALIAAPLLIFISSSQVLGLSGQSLGIYARFTLGALSWPLLVQPFGILAAGLYSEHGLGMYLFFIIGSLLASLLTHELSRTVENAQLRSRELRQLERLGRGLLSGPPDGSRVVEVLEEQVPSMFPNCRLEIRILPGQQILLSHPADRPPDVGEAAWCWLAETTEVHHFLPGSAVPWQPDRTLRDEAVIVAPIMGPEDNKAIGGIYLTRRRNPRAAADLSSAVQSLAAQIGSALHLGQVYQQTVANERMEQELLLAGEIQASFLPTELPQIPGWQLTVTLKPAKETSGDFYDLIPLPNNQLGIVVADVADKGMGAALYMALARTLLRTYALQYHNRPDYVMRVTNRRILMDTDSDLFVTVFYAVLDPASGTLTYCNAGHNPPLIFDRQDGHAPQALRRTGIPLGMFVDRTWEQKSVQLAPGDTLLLYTDGVTEAHNRELALWGLDRMVEVMEATLGRPAHEIQSAILLAVQRFMGDSPQFDDMAVIVVVRDDGSGAAA
jgi:serine phosphatase RsbU (regulator of sigma subunit)